MPNPPGDWDEYDKVNYIIRAWAKPCVAPWYIYVECLKPAALAAFITLATFGWDDVARGYFRPTGLGRRSSKGKRRGRGGAGWRMPEFGEETGRRLPGADEVKGQKWSKGAKALWRIDTAMQQALFWWLVADVTLDFAFNFTSLLYETEWCRAAHLGRFSYRQPEMIGKGGLYWTNVAFPVEDYEENPPSWGYTRGYAGSTGCDAGCAVSFRKNPSFPAPTQTAVRMLERGTGKVLAQTGPEITDIDGGNDLALMGDMPPGTIWMVQTWHDSIYCDVGDAVTFATESQL